MSAYICSREHILYLVEMAMHPRIIRNSGAFRWWHEPPTGEDGQWHELRCGDFDRAAEVANMLWCENFASVSHRYPHESSGTLPGPIAENFVVGPRDFQFWPDISHVQIFKACHCYAYQTCEHPGWKTSQANAFIDSLCDSTQRAMPGYEDAEWGAPERDHNAPQSILLSSLIPRRK